MTALLVIWRFLKPFWGYLFALAVLASLLSAYGHREYKRGSTSRDAEVAREKARGDGYLANQIKLTEALNHQSAAVVALKVEGAQRVLDGKKALSEAQRANHGLIEQRDALRKSAGRKVDSAPCPISDTLRTVGSI